MLLFQILFLFTNDTSSLHGQIQSRHGKLNLAVKKLRQELGVKIVPVAIGHTACVDDLRKIATMPDRVISSGVNDDPSNLERKLLRGNYSIVCFLLRISVIYDKCCQRSRCSYNIVLHRYFFSPKNKGYSTIMSTCILFM